MRLNIFILIYFLGLINVGVKTYLSYKGIQELKEKTGVDLLQKRGMKFYMVAKPLFWPFYLVTEKNPLERISELFFKNYGEEGVIYYRAQGLRNFVNDVFYGKKRYQHYQTNKLLWVLDENANEYKKQVKAMGITPSSHVLITCAQSSDKQTYLVYIMFGDKKCLVNNKPVSRFDLDSARRLSFHQFKQQLYDINPLNAEELFKE